MSGDLSPRARRHLRDAKPNSESNAEPTSPPSPPPQAKQPLPPSGPTSLFRAEAVRSPPTAPPTATRPSVPAAREQKGGSDPVSSPPVAGSGLTAVGEAAAVAVPSRPSGSGALQVGARVRISGLVARADLNGRSGRVLSYDEAVGRHTVAVDGAGPVAFKPGNLSAEGAPPPHSPQAEAAGAESEGVLTEEAEAMQRVATIRAVAEEAEAEAMAMVAKIRAEAEEEAEAMETAAKIRAEAEEEAEAMETAAKIRAEAEEAEAMAFAAKIRADSE